METMNNKEPESEKNLEERLNKEVATFFDTEPNECNAVMHDSWDDLAQSWSVYHDDVSLQAPNWLVGYSASKDTVHILSPSIMPAGHEKNGELRFEKTLKHELGHLYVRKINGYSPHWLDEGVCQIMAGQTSNLPKGLDKITVALLYEVDDSLADGRIYGIGKYMADQIMGNYGKGTLLELVALKDKNAVYVKLKEMFSWLV